jgi:imipenem/basic amino acid-specific outer membrane pore
VYLNHEKTQGVFMKFTKLSLAAIAAVGFASSAFAVENVKVDGSIKLWYQTTDNTSVATDGATAASKNDGIFKQNSSTGDLAAKLRATGDLTKKVGFGMTMYAVSTLGLENNLVSGEAVTAGATSSDGTSLNGTDRNPYWLGEAYFVYKAGKTIAKIGRQELDTPLAFTETWNAAPNTFEAAVLVNQDLPDTTLIAAYVARGNGNNNNLTPNGSTLNASGTFTSYHNNTAALKAAALVAALGGGVGSAADLAANSSDDHGGAYALGMVNKSIPGLTIHPVYYNVTDTATAGWIDVTYVGLPVVKVEALYSYVSAAGVTDKVLKGLGIQDRQTDAYAAKVSGSVAGVNLGASYSNVSKGVFPIANTATNFVKTKIYTASILSDGRVAAQPDVSAWKLEASTKLAGFDLGASYASYDVKANNGGYRLFDSYGLDKDKSPSEIDLSISTKVDEINIAAYYVMQNDYATVGTEARDRTAVRVIASINF